MLEDGLFCIMRERRVSQVSLAILWFGCVSFSLSCNGEGFEVSSFGLGRSENVPLLGLNKFALFFSRMVC